MKAPARKVIITGASSGIGRALALEYAAHGPVTWHDGRTKFQRRTNKARSNAFFVDGHVSYTAIYYDNRQGPWEYNPPPGGGFDYVWFEP